LLFSWSKTSTEKIPVFIGTEVTFAQGVAPSIEEPEQFIEDLQRGDLREGLPMEATKGFIILQNDE